MSRAYPTAPTEVGVDLQASADDLGLRRGDKVDDYVIVDRLGCGGSGVVYSAFDQKLERLVALKVLQSGPFAGQHRLWREARALARVSHPHVAAVFAVGIHEGHSFVAMELVRGLTLRQWLEEPRTPEAVTAAFVQAARGLQAVHNNGLVHRDFKPSNAMIDGENHVRVLDFGLAWTFGATSTTEVSGTVVETQGFVGTPRYMAPEQFLGEPVTPATDQFSFCVALYESLFGEPPFCGETIETLRVSVCQGELGDAHRRSTLPRSLRAAVVRGLAGDPRDRWPSMAVLADVLQRKATTGRWPWIAGTIAAIALGVGLLGSLGEKAGDPLCSPDALDSIWKAQRDEVRERIAVQPKSYAGVAAGQVDDRLSEFANRWRDTQASICSGSNDVLSVLERVCLLEHRHQLQSVVDVLAEVDGTTVEYAVPLASSLTSPADCLERTYLQSRPLPPRNPAAIPTIDSLQLQLAYAGAWRAVGQIEKGRALLDAVTAEVEATDYGPLRALVWLEKGKLAEDEGRETAGVAEFERAYSLATQERADWIAADAAHRLAAAYGTRLQPESAAVWMERATQLAERLPAHYPLEDGILFAKLGAAFADGRYEDAIEFATAQLELRRERLGTNAFPLIATIGNIGVAQLKLGRYEDARANFERALERKRATLGGRHPSTADTLQKLGIIERATGNLAAAQRHQELALEIMQESYGPVNVHVSRAWMSLGNLRENLGDYEGALAAHRQALAILEEIAPDDLAWIAMCLANIYVVLDSQGRYQEALQMAERQMGLFRRAFGEDHPESLGAVNNLGVALLRVGRASDAFDTFVELRERMRGREVDASALANTLNNIGLAQHDLGRYRAALRSYQEALQIKRREFGERHFSVAETLVNVAATSARQGRHREAIEHNRHAIAIWRDVYGEDHIEVAGAWSAIGTSLARLRRSDEAREAFVKALEIYKNAGHDDHPDARDTVQALRRLDRR